MLGSGIRARVLFVALAPAALIAVLVTAWFTWSRVTEIERSLRERGEAIVRQLAPASEYGVISGNVEILETLAESALRERDMLDVTVADSSGKVLMSRSRPPAEPGAEALAFSAPILQSRVEVFDFVESEPKPPLRSLGTVTVSLSQGGMLALKHRFVLMGIAISVLGFALGALLAVNMSRRVTRPILGLADAVQRMGRGELDVRVPVDGDGEIQALQNGVNAMAAALEEMRGNLQGLVDERTADLLKAKEAAEAANRAKSVFLANISHELRTPLHAVLSLASFGLEKIDRASKDTLLQYFSLIHQSGKRLLHELNDLLDMAKLEAGKMRYSMEECDVADIAGRVAAECRELLAAKHLELEIQPPQVVTRTVCDDLRIGQVMHNLISNAIKFSPEGGRIEIAFAHSQVPRNPDPGAACITGLAVTVCDTGEGVPAGEEERIFQKFMQSSRDSDGQGGTGLGLAICREIVSAHGGEIWAENATEGGGACFTFALPLITRTANSREDELAAS